MYIFSSSFANCSFSQLIKKSIKLQGLENHLTSSGKNDLGRRSEQL